MSVVISPEMEARIDGAYFMWFTTVRADGMPQPTPVWFIYEHGSFLLYSKPDAQKVKNIRHNAKVALNFGEDEEGEEFGVIMGEAVFDESTPLSNQHPAFFAKYEEGIARIGMTPEGMAQEFSLPIRVTPLHVRGD